MSAVVDLLHVGKHHRNKVRCKRVTSLDGLNSMLKHEFVVSVYHYDKGSTIVYYVYYIEEEDDGVYNPWWV